MKDGLLHEVLMEGITTILDALNHILPYRRQTFGRLHQEVSFLTMELNEEQYRSYVDPSMSIEERLELLRRDNEFTALNFKPLILDSEEFSILVDAILAYCSIGDFLRCR